MERSLDLQHTDIKWFEWYAAECCSTSQRQLRKRNCTKIMKCMFLEMFFERMSNIVYSVVQLSSP